LVESQRDSAALGRDREELLDISASRMLARFCVCATYVIFDLQGHDSAMLDPEPPGPGRASRRSSAADFTRYVVIGVCTVALDVGLLVFTHQVLGFPLAVATTVAYAASWLFNFSLNRYWIVGTEARGVTRHAARFTALVAANYAITVAVVTSADSWGVPYVVAKVAVVIASTSWNYLLYRHWVFAPAGRGRRKGASARSAVRHDG
jgi:putative flippase GtrA